MEEEATQVTNQELGIINKMMIPVMMKVGEIIGKSSKIKK